MPLRYLLDMSELCLQLPLRRQSSQTWCLSGISWTCSTGPRRSAASFLLRVLAPWTTGLCKILEKRALHRGQLDSISAHCEMQARQYLRSCTAVNILCRMLNKSMQPVHSKSPPVAAPVQLANILRWSVKADATALHSAAKACQQLLVPARWARASRLLSVYSPASELLLQLSLWTCDLREQCPARWPRFSWTQPRRCDSGYARAWWPTGTPNCARMPTVPLLYSAGLCALVSRYRIHWCSATSFLDPGWSGKQGVSARAEVLPKMAGPGPGPTVEQLQAQVADLEDQARSWLLNLAHSLRGEP